MKYSCNGASVIPLSHPDYKYCATAHSNPISAVVNLTDECSCRCEYCFVNFSQQHMPLDTAIRTAEWLLENAKRSGAEILPNFTFFGGEPLLRYREIIVPIVEKYTGQLSFNITTNGTLLTEDIIDFFAKYGVKVLLSMDGDKTTQDRQRPLKDGSSSFAKLDKIIPYLLLKLPDTTFRATLTRASIPEMYNNFLYTKRRGFLYCNFIINTNEEYSSKDMDILQDQYDKIAIDTVEALIKENKGIPTFCMLGGDLQEIDNLNNQYVKDNNVMRCGTATTSCGVDINGGIHPCQEENSKDSFVIGNVFTGINEKLHEEFLSSFYTLRSNLDCQGKCSLKTKIFCLKGVCPNRMQTFPNTGHCISSMVRYKTASRLYLLFKDTPNPLVRRILFNEE